MPSGEKGPSPVAVPSQPAPWEWPCEKDKSCIIPNLHGSGAVGHNKSILTMAVTQEMQQAIQQKISEAMTEWSAQIIAPQMLALENNVRTSMTAMNERVTAIEQSSKDSRKNDKTGLQKMFDGKNPKLVPDRFDKEGSKTFKKWAAQVFTYVDLADPEAAKGLTEALKDDGDEDEDPEVEANQR
eukprot:12408198-Karenia_brevis.AAC.1